MFIIPKKNYKYVVRKHFEGVEKFVRDDINEQLDIYMNKKKNPKYVDILSEMLMKNSEIYYQKILCYNPEKLIDVYEAFVKKFPYFKQKDKNKKNKNVFDTDGMSDCHFKTVLEKCFNYNNFKKRKWGAYALCKELKIDVCPYCNRQYILTVFDNKARRVIRPELDHYLPQFKYPMFALSFFNLIPSCHICNSNVKGSGDLDIKKHHHPYIKNDVDFKFEYTATPDKDKYKDVKLHMDYRGNTKDENTCGKFKINEIYLYHVDIIEEILNKSVEYNYTYIKELSEILKGTSKAKTEEEILKLVFNDLNYTETFNRPLGKLKADILDKLINEKYKSLKKVT